MGGRVEEEIEAGEAAARVVLLVGRGEADHPVIRLDRVRDRPVLGMQPAVLGLAPPARDLGLAVDAVELLGIAGVDRSQDHPLASQHAESAHDATSSTRSISTASAQRSKAWSHQ